MTQLLNNEPMSKHTSWRLGGPVDTYFRPDSLDSLRNFLLDLDSGAPVYFSGLGSNLLVRDGGIRGVVINPLKALAQVERLDGNRVEAGAGVACTAFARRCAAWGLGPSDYFAGIPGTIGGALAMNAGAFGGETWDRVAEVVTVDRMANLRTRDRGEYTVAYRQISGPEGEWFVAARFDFDSDADFSLDRVRALMRERQDKQPLGLPSCGSVFRNPPGNFAAQLIESSGLKGYRVGGAEVSEKHANFIINTGAASAADVEAVIAHIQEVVQSRHGVALELEVHIVGEMS